MINDNQRLTIIESLVPNIFKVSSDSVGTLCMQRLLEKVKLEEEKHIFFKAIKSKIVQLAFADKGNYVLALFLTNAIPEHFNYIA